MVKFRYGIPLLLLLLAALVAGCGGSSSSGGSSGAGSELADLAAPGSLVFLEAKLQPKGELATNADAVAKRFTGANSLSEFIVSELESSARAEGEPFDFEKEVEPWLGEEGGVAFERLVDGELSEPLIAVQTTDPKATEAFVDKQTEQASKPSKDVSFEGVGFKVGGKEDDALGVIGKALVLADSEKEFKAAIEASNGDSLGGEDRFQSTMASAASGSLANVYVDIGGIVEQSKGSTGSQVREMLERAGIDTSEATAVASVIPHSEQIEVDVKSELGGEQAATGNSSKLLGSLPASSVAALSFAGFNEQLEEAVDNLDEEGIPPELGPGELKSSLQQAGVDIEKLVDSLQEGAVFVEGDSNASLGGTLVVTAKSDEAAEAVASFGTLLRAANVPGITAVSGKASGFSIRSGELGGRSLVVVGKGDRIAIGTLKQAIAGLNAGSGSTLSGTAGYKEAVAALGKTPISGYADGASAVKLAEALVPHSKSEFWQAVPYLKKITYVGIGSGTDGDMATAKLIAGVGK
jgi:hypothetical protein